MTDPPAPQPPADPTPAPLPEAPAEAPRQAPAERYPFWGYRDVAMLTGLSLVVFVVVGSTAQLFFRAREVTALQAIVVTFVFEALCFGLLYGLIRFGYDRPFWRSLAWLPTRYGFWRCLAWGVLTAVGLVMVAAILPRPVERTLLEELLKDRASILLVGFFAITLGPLFEELAFRGFLMPLLVRTFGVAAGIALQAIPFTVVHGVQYKWAWQVLILLFLAGAAFGWIRHKTGSTAASTYMHVGYNLVEFVGMLAQSFVR